MHRVNTVPPLRVHGITHLLLKNKQPARPQVTQAKPTVVKPQQVLTSKLVPKLPTQTNVQRPAVKPIMEKLNKLAPGTGRKISPLFSLCCDIQLTRNLIQQEI